MYYITDQFSHTHPDRIDQIWHYWDGYIEMEEARKGNGQSGPRR